MITLYGIPNCDTVKKARAWLDGQGLPYHFHDLRKDGVSDERLDRWLAMLGHDVIINRKGSTWRSLDDAERQSVINKASARRLLKRLPTLIKRPLVEWAEHTMTVGFQPDEWDKLM